MNQAPMAPAPAPQGPAPQGAPAPQGQAPAEGAGSIVTPDSPVVEAFRTLAMYVAAQLEKGAPNSAQLQSALDNMASAFTGGQAGAGAPPPPAPQGEQMPPPPPQGAPAPAPQGAPAPMAQPAQAAPAPKKNARKGGPSTEQVMKSNGGKVPIM